MTQERKNELYDKMLAWICEHIQNDEDLFLTLKGQLGMTQEEVYDSRIDGLDEFFVKDKIKPLIMPSVNAATIPKTAIGQSPMTSYIIISAQM